LLRVLQGPALSAEAMQQQRRWSSTAVH
jgi:hypothetical protein